MDEILAGRNGLNLFDVFGFGSTDPVQSAMDYPDLSTEYGTQNSGSDVDPGAWWALNEQPVPTENANETVLKNAENNQNLMTIVLVAAAGYFLMKGF